MVQPETSQSNWFSAGFGTKAICLLPLIGLILGFWVSRTPEFLVQTTATSIYTADLTRWRETFIGNPATLSPVSSHNQITLTDDGLRIVGPANLFSKGLLPVNPSSRYRLSFRLKSRHDGGLREPVGIRLGLAHFDKNKMPLFSNSYRYSVWEKQILPAYGWMTYEAEIQGIGKQRTNFKPNTAFVRLVLLLNYKTPEGTTEFKEIKLEKLNE